MFIVNEKNISQFQPAKGDNYGHELRADNHFCLISANTTLVARLDQD